MSQIKSEFYRTKTRGSRTLLTVESNFSISDLSKSSENKDQCYLPILLSLSTKYLVQLVNTYDLPLEKYKHNSNNILHCLVCQKPKDILLIQEHCKKAFKAC